MNISLSSTAKNPTDNKIYITCNTSNWRTGTTLSWGKTWESVYPVAFNLLQLKGAEKNYLIHKKELLSIIHILKKWHTNLTGSKIYVYMDHKTLQNFDQQCDLSHHQLW